MLVCSFFGLFGTRDRGCSVHPAFPAPSDSEERETFWQTSGASRRGNAKVYLHHRHCEFSTGAGATLMDKTNTAVIARLDGRPSIPETVVFNREAAAYWIPRMRGG
jgi:hypothetical protein